MVFWFGCHVDFTCFMIIFNDICAKRLEIMGDVMHKFWACKSKHAMSLQHHCISLLMQETTDAHVLAKCECPGEPLIHSRSIASNDVAKKCNEQFANVRCHFILFVQPIFVWHTNVSRW